MLKNKQNIKEVKGNKNKMTQIISDNKAAAGVASEIIIGKAAITQLKKDNSI